MADLDQRVTRLEERSEAQTATMDFLRHDMSDLRRSVEALSTELRTDIAALRTEVKTDIAALRTEVKTDIAALRTEVKADIEVLRAELGGEISDLRNTFDHRFTWLVGLMVTGFVVTIGTIAGAFWGVLQFVR